MGDIIKIKNGGTRELNLKRKKKGLIIIPILWNIDTLFSYFLKKLEHLDGIVSDLTLFFDRNGSSMRRF